MATNYATDPGLIWRPTLKRPKHAATVRYEADGSYTATCPLCGDLSEPETHASAMLRSLNHRR